MFDVSAEETTGLGGKQGLQVAFHGQRDDMLGCDGISSRCLDVRACAQSGWIDWQFIHRFTQRVCKPLSIGYEAVMAPGAVSLTRR